MRTITEDILSWAIETVEVDDPNVEIIEEGSHGNHAKKPAKKY